MVLNHGGKQESGRIPRARLDLGAVLNFLYSKKEAADFLLAKDIAPPFMPSQDTLGNSLCVSSLVISEQPVGVLVRTPWDWDHAEQGELGNDEEKLAIRQIFNQDPAQSFEHILYVPCYENDQYSLLTLADNRLPISFLEQPVDLVPGLRRVVCLKLDEVGYPDSFIVFQHFWLLNGRSSLMVVLYSLEPQAYTEKHFLLFGRYPASRYPQLRDMLEYLLALDSCVCVFCSLRGAENCSCSTTIVERMKIPVPGRESRDPGTLMRWVIEVFETGFRKYTTMLNHFPSSTQHFTSVHHGGIPAKSHGRLRALGTENYLRKLREFAGMRVSWRASSVLALPAAEDTLEPIDGGHRTVVQAEDDRELALCSAQAGTASALNPVQGDDMEEKLFSLNEGIQRVAEMNSFEGLMKAGIPMRPRTVDPSNPSQIHPNLYQSRDEIWNSNSNEVSDARVDVKIQTPPPQPESDSDGLAESYYREIQSSTWKSNIDHVCKMCNAVFSRRHDLKRHVMSKHVKRRRFTCNKCNKDFTRKAQLEQHSAAMHEKVEYHCEHCGRAFSYPGARKRHLKTQHGVQAAVGT